MSDFSLSFPLDLVLGCFVVLGYFCYVVLCDPIVLLIVFIVCLGRVSGVRTCYYDSLTYEDHQQGKS